MKTSPDLSECLYIFNYLKLLRVFSNEFCEGLRTLFYRTTLVAASVRPCEMKIFLSPSSPDSYKVILLQENLGSFFSFCATFSCITPFHVTGLFLYLP